MLKQLAVRFFEALYCLFMLCAYIVMAFLKAISMVLAIIVSIPRRIRHFFGKNKTNKLPERTSDLIDALNCAENFALNDLKKIDCSIKGYSKPILIKEYRDKGKEFLTNNIDVVTSCAQLCASIYFNNDSLVRDQAEKHRYHSIQSKVLDDNDIKVWIFRRSGSPSIVVIRGSDSFTNWRLNGRIFDRLGELSYKSVCEEAKKLPIFWILPYFAIFMFYQKTKVYIDIPLLLTMIFTLLSPFYFLHRKHKDDTQVFHSGYMVIAREIDRALNGEDALIIGHSLGGGIARILSTLNPKYYALMFNAAPSIFYSQKVLERSINFVAHGDGLTRLITGFSNLNGNVPIDDPKPKILEKFKPKTLTHYLIYAALISVSSLVVWFLKIQPHVIIGGFLLGLSYVIWNVLYQTKHMWKSHKMASVLNSLAEFEKRVVNAPKTSDSSSRKPGNRKF